MQKYKDIKSSTILHWVVSMLELELYNALTSINVFLKRKISYFKNYNLNYILEWFLYLIVRTPFVIWSFVLYLAILVTKRFFRSIKTEERIQLE